MCKKAAQKSGFLLCKGIEKELMRESFTRRDFVCSRGVPEAREILCQPGFDPGQEVVKDLLTVDLIEHLMAAAGV